MAELFEVFLSGVINDTTRPFRALIKQEIERAGWANVWAFEKEPAHDSLEDSYLSPIDRSDLFVLCLWDDISVPVQREFDRASRAGIPRLVFLADVGPPNEKLQLFLESIQRDLKWEKCHLEELPSAVQKAVVGHLIDVHRRRFVKQTFRSTPEKSRGDTGAAEGPIVPSSEHSAALLAVRVVPGRIVRAVPFVDEKDGRSRIAVLAERGGFPGTQNVYLLEEFAGGYQIGWTSENLAYIGAWRVQSDWFGAEDVDGDLRHEVFFGEGSHGTGSGADVLHVYIPNNDTVLSLSVEETRDPYYRTWIVPCRELKDPQNEAYLKALESRMRAFGLMVEVKIADESPEVLWYMDNGFMKFGKVKVRRFPGPPSFGASVEARHVDGNVEWYAYFKGPVMGHDLSRNEHFVIYGPETMYRWPTCFLSNEQYLWFGTRGDGAFQYDKQREILAQLPRGFLRECPADVSSLELRGTKLVVNGLREFGAPWE